MHNCLCLVFGQEASSRRRRAVKATLHNTMPLRLGTSGHTHAQVCPQRQPRTFTRSNMSGFCRIASNSARDRSGSLSNWDLGAVCVTRARVRVPY